MITNQILKTRNVFENEIKGPLVNVTKNKHNIMERKMNFYKNTIQPLYKKI